MGTAVANGARPLTVADLLAALIKAYEIQGCIALENSFNRVGLDHVVLVLGCEHERIRRCLGSSTAHPKCEILVNPDYRSGQSTSLQAGLLRVRHDFPSAMFLLGDQPLVDAALINLLLQRHAGSEKPICVPTHRGTRGNPTLFARRFYPEILKLAGDKGARDIIAAHPDQVLAVEIPDPRELNPSLPVGLVDVLRKVTAVKPEDRPASAGEVMQMVYSSSPYLNLCFVIVLLLIWIPP